MVIENGSPRIALLGSEAVAAHGRSESVNGDSVPLCLVARAVYRGNDG